MITIDSDSFSAMCSQGWQWVGHWCTWTGYNVSLSWGSGQASPVHTPNIRSVDVSVGQIDFSVPLCLPSTHFNCAHCLIWVTSYLLHNEAVICCSPLGCSACGSECSPCMWNNAKLLEIMLRGWTLIHYSYAPCDIQLSVQVWETFGNILPSINSFQPSI